MLSMRKILSTIVLGMALSSVAVFANPSRGNQPGRGQQPGRDLLEERTIYIENYMRNETTDIGFMFDLDPLRDRNLEVVALEVITRPGNRRSVLTLTADNRVQARHEAYLSTYLDPVDRLLVGRNFDRLFLHVSDKLYVESITLHLSRWMR
jgi:hypothetical protein